MEIICLFLGYLFHTIHFLYFVHHLNKQYKKTEMSLEKILHITSSGRNEGSISRQVSDLVVDYLKNASQSLNIVSRDVAPGLPFVNEEWINSNFTASEERSADQKEVLSFSDELVAELQNADHIVIASPIYNFSIPAALKAWVDLIARAGLTFRYTDKGPVGLLEDKKVTLVMASGGVPIGSEMDMASSYLKFVLGFVGIHDVNVIDASTINYTGDQSLESAKTQIAASMN